jgi:hypothetical protein
MDHPERLFRPLRSARNTIPISSMLMAASSVRMKKPGRRGSEDVGGRGELALLRMLR